MIVLDDGGYIHRNGAINGTGFPAGTHPRVLNTGGDLNSGFSPGKLTIDGEYIQEAGVLTLEISGTNPGEYDVLDATQGASFLGGTLRFENPTGFTGVIGTQLDFFPVRSVSFDPSVMIEDYTGFGLAFDFATGVATITQGTVPEPPIAALLHAGVGGLGWIGRRRHARVIASASEFERRRVSPIFRQLNMPFTQMLPIFIFQTTHRHICLNCHNRSIRG